MSKIDVGQLRPYISNGKSKVTLDTGRGYRTAVPTKWLEMPDAVLTKEQWIELDRAVLQIINEQLGADFLKECGITLMLVQVERRPEPDVQVEASPTSPQEQKEVHHEDVEGTS